MKVQEKDVYDIILEDKGGTDMLSNSQGEKWETVKYSKKKIHNAGKILAEADVDLQTFKEQIDILNNWRSSHAYPLDEITKDLRKNHDNALVVQRLKRLDSIIAKLQRFEAMSLYRMQDLGGCRVIVDTIEDVYAAKEKYKEANSGHILIKENDYIEKPQTTGYRSYHMIYEFRSNKEESYNKNMLIEIQFRTKLQHIWATAVETMGIYYSETLLKAGIGDNDTLRFFALVSTVFASWEETTSVPGTPLHIGVILKEINAIDKKHNITSRLSAIKVAMDHVGGDKRNGHFILLLNYKQKILRIKRAKNIEEATRIYNSIEKEQGQGIDAVLVSATSFDSLKEAYPNYFSDMDQFVKIMRSILTY